MTISLRSLCASLACVLYATIAGAQTPATSSSTPSSPSAESSTRPATTTFFGDTGIWYVPTAEILPSGKWSASVYRRGTNWIQGYTNVGDFAGTFAVGVKDRAEIFGSFLFDTRIDRDIRPIFVNDPTFGGVIDRYPNVTQSWTGDNVGDLYVGAKVNLWSESRQNPAAIALRGMIKLPTGKSDVGVSTGKADGSLDLIVSKEAAKMVDVSGYAGYEFRGKPDGFDAPTGAFRWGTGVAFPSRNFLRVSAELTGELPSKDSATFQGVVPLCVGCAVMPLVSNTENITRATLGLTAQAKNGLFGGVGVSWNVPTKARSSAFTDESDVLGDYYDLQVRIGYHPGTKVYLPPPAPTPPPPPPPPPAPVHNLTVKAACDPCTVEIGKTSTVTATAQDSMSCAVTYRWTAPTGALAQPAERRTIWTATNQEGSVPVTVTATCPTDNKTASDTVNIRVIKPVVPIRFEDVYFDFDRSTLRQEALRLLDEAVTALQANPEKNVIIEGHTCNIGTSEYNLSLSTRRANSVRDYMISRGVAATRMEIVSKGEESPMYDNSREETRRLNRRAHLLVKVQ
jgi:outer membrane protein OmpA-like peptidoglycan-associated protein